MTEAKHKERKKRARRMIKKLKKLYPVAKTVLVYSNNREALVSIILSAQCTDKKVNEVTAKLFKKYKTLDDYVNAKPSAFEKDIYQTGFYRAKTKNILGAAKMLKEEFGGRLPKTMDEMIKLPGVARKTANIALHLAYGIQVGVPVDTHVKRLAYKYKLTDHTDPKKIEQDLMEVLPKEEWVPTTYRLVQYGRDYCPAKKHDHASCPLTKLL